MKKIGLLVVFLLLFTGCYDYVEINEMAIVYGISVDYQSDEYAVTFEILNTKNKDDVGQEEKVYYAHGKGLTISEAFTNTSFEIAKTPYLAHLKTVIISEEIAKNKLEDLLDFLLRDNHIRNIFYLVMAKDTKAENILTAINTNNPIVSNAISDMIEHKNLKNNIASSMNFEKFMTTMVDKREDVFLTSLQLQDDLLKLGSMGIFHEYQFVDYLSEKESSTFNLLHNEALEYHFTVTCPNSPEDTITLSTKGKPKSKIEVQEDKVDINVESEFRIIENHCALDYRDQESFKMLEEQVNQYIEKQINELVETTKNKESDILKIRKLYYQKYKKDTNFKELQYDAKMKATINHIGLTFEVKR